jgi:hypothetical protein
VLCCAAEIGMLAFGIFALIRGRFALSSNRVVQGTPARIIGGLLLLPLIVGQGGEITLGAMWGIERGMKGQPVDFQAAVQEAGRDLTTKVLVLNGIAVAVPLIAVVIISLVTAKPPKKKKRRRDEDSVDDDYERDDERPRRRRERDKYDDEENRPPRRRDRRDDDEEGDRPPPRRAEPDDRYQDRSRRRRESRDED